VKSEGNHSRMSTPPTDTSFWTLRGQSEENGLSEQENPELQSTTGPVEPGWGVTNKGGEKWAPSFISSSSEPHVARGKEDEPRSLSPDNKRYRRDDAFTNCKIPLSLHSLFFHELCS
jgi:hypothetical protein